MGLSQRGAHLIRWGGPEEVRHTDPLSTDYEAARLRAAAYGSKYANQTRRLFTLPAIYDGATRTEGAVIGGVTVQILLDCVVKLNTYGLADLIDRRGGCTLSRLTDEHRRTLAVAIEDGSIRCSSS